MPEYDPFRHPEQVPPYDTESLDAIVTGIQAVMADMPLPAIRTKYFQTGIYFDDEITFLHDDGSEDVYDGLLVTRDRDGAFHEIEVLADRDHQPYRSIISLSEDTRALPLRYEGIPQAPNALRSLGTRMAKGVVGVEFVEPAVFLAHERSVLIDGLIDMCHGLAAEAEFRDFDDEPLSSEDGRYVHVTAFPEQTVKSYRLAVPDQRIISLTSLIPRPHDDIPLKAVDEIDWHATYVSDGIPAQRLLYGPFIQISPVTSPKELTTDFLAMLADDIRSASLQKIDSHQD